jgi:beta-1,3-galactosyltransferase 1
MKCDDDTFVNIPNLIHVLLGGTVPLYKSTLSCYDKNSILVTKQKNRLSSDIKNMLIGYKFCNAKKILDERSKWYAPNYMFDGSYYPDYLSGTAYVFTMDTAKLLYNGSLNTPVFHLEDVYLTGFVAEKIKIKRTHHPLFFYQYSKDKCSMRGMISQHQIKPAEMEELYNFATNLTIKCSVPEKNFMTKFTHLTQKKRCH